MKTWASVISRIARVAKSGDSSVLVIQGHDTRYDMGYEARSPGARGPRLIGVQPGPTNEEQK